MNHSDHVALLRNSHIKPHSVWADLGSGDGAFTLALRDIGGPSVHIYSIDKDALRLSSQKSEFNRQFPQSNIEYIQQDFTKNLDLPFLDGILMANSLHFIKNKTALLKKLLRYIKPQGYLILIEYDNTTGNIWVPYPVSFTMFQQEASHWGLNSPVFLNSIFSEFMTAIYSAEAKKR